MQERDEAEPFLEWAVETVLPCERLENLPQPSKKTMQQLHCLMMTYKIANMKKVTLQAQRNVYQAELQDTITHLKTR